MYLDESYDDKASFICLAGVIVRNDKWKTLNEGIDSLKMTYFNDLDYNLKMITVSPNRVNFLDSNG